jgi:hypothetical protein
MLRLVFAILGTTALVVRFCVLGGLGLGAALSVVYALSWFVRHGGFPEVSVASLYIDVYNYLLPTRHVVLNTVFIYCVKLPVVVLALALFFLALLLDRLVCSLFGWLGAALRSDETA